MKDFIIATLFLFPTFIWAQQFLDCGLLTDVDGNRYETVRLGKQCWMRSNLRATHYADGQAIDPADGQSAHGYYFPNGDSTIVGRYGLLYTWLTAMRDHLTSEEVPSGVQGVCPDGWHLPSNFEWMNLEDYLGYKDEYRCGSDVNNVARAMASPTDWDTDIVGMLQPCCIVEDVSGNNVAHMDVLPAGLCFMGYYGYGTECGFWTASDGSPETSPIHRFYAPNATVEINCTPKEAGASVRCVKDE